VRKLITTSIRIIQMSRRMMYLSMLVSGSLPVGPAARGGGARAGDRSCYLTDTNVRAGPVA
jgi:hypothetical protein